MERHRLMSLLFLRLGKTVFRLSLVGVLMLKSRRCVCVQKVNQTSPPPPPPPDKLTFYKKYECEKAEYSMSTLDRSESPTSGH